MLLVTSVALVTSTTHALWAGRNTWERKGAEPRTVQLISCLPISEGYTLQLSSSHTKWSYFDLFYSVNIITGTASSHTHTLSYTLIYTHTRRPGGAGHWQPCIASPPASLRHGPALILWVGWSQIRCSSSCSPSSSGDCGKMRRRTEPRWCAVSEPVRVRERRRRRRDPVWSCIRVWFLRRRRRADVNDSRGLLGICV